MAEIRTALVTHLMADSNVTAVFGNRITVDRVPDLQAYPHAVITVISSPVKYHQHGKSGRKVRAQLDIFSDTQASVDAGTLILENSLSGFKGMMGDMDVGYTFVKNITGDYAFDIGADHRILEVEVGTND